MKMSAGFSWQIRSQVFRAQNYGEPSRTILTEMLSYEKELTADNGRRN
jgi:hypothetical protein